MKTIQKTILIQAAPAKIWDVLTQDQYTREWYTAFSEGTHATSDWKEGSRITFTDGSGDGMIGFIAESRPGKSLVFEFTGQIVNGKEDTESEQVQAFKGGQERYRITEKDNGAELEIHSDMTEEYYDMMSAKWDEGLQIIKNLAESN